MPRHTPGTFHGHPSTQPPAHTVITVGAVPPDAAVVVIPNNNLQAPPRYYGNPHAARPMFFANPQVPQHVNSYAPTPGGHGQLPAPAHRPMPGHVHAAHSHVHGHPPVGHAHAPHAHAPTQEHGHYTTPGMRPY